MIYLYKGKLYVRPMSNVLVEVTIIKDNSNSYDVKATKNRISIEEKDRDDLSELTVEEAYKRQTKMEMK